jgi:hypothetical protein
VSRDQSADFGPWAEDDFEKTVRTSAAVGADSGLPDEVRFIAAIAKLIRRCIAEGGDTLDPPRPAVFLLKPTAPEHKPNITPKRVPMLNNGLTVVSGRLWFVSPVVVAGSYVELEHCDDDDLFRFVADELQLGDVPAVVFEPRTRTPEIRFYQNGLGDPETCEVSSVGSTDVSLETVFENIDRIYRRGLVTPDAQKQAGKLWKDNGRWWPNENAEHIVQLYLWAGLTTAFPMCTVRSEQDNVSGRLDLEIEESDPIDRSKFVRHAILELKVLRSYRSTGKPVSSGFTLNWVESGVKQAASYRDERCALAAALCCFDMRCENTGEECFNHVFHLAKEHKVKLKVWFIYATSSQYRDATIGSAES